MRWGHWLGIALCMAGAGAGAQQVYRSVDDQGKVIFSDKPPADARSVTPVQIKAGPSEAAVRDAVARERALGEAASRVGKTKTRVGAEQSGASSQVDPKAALAEAERRLDEAKQVGPGDRKGTAGGGSRLSEEYRQRVQAAEAAVEAARQRVKQSE